MEVRRQFQESVFSFHSVGRGEQTQFVRIGGKFLYCLSHLTGPSNLLFLFIFKIRALRKQNTRSKEQSDLTTGCLAGC